MILREAADEEWGMRFGGIEKVKRFAVPSQSEVAAKDSLSAHTPGRCLKQTQKSALSEWDEVTAIVEALSGCDKGAISSTEECARTLTLRIRAASRLFN